MEQLKATTAQEIVRKEKDCDYMDELFGGVKMPPTQVYIKSEADKVIAERDEKIDELKERIDELQKATDSAWSKVNAMYDELRHQKYKRCLDKAEMCGVVCDKWMMRKAKAIVLGKDGVKKYYQAKRKLFLFIRWQTRWLKIAEQFKEA